VCSKVEKCFFNLPKTTKRLNPYPILSCVVISAFIILQYKKMLGANFSFENANGDYTHCFSALVSCFCGFESCGNELKVNKRVAS
jgi:hypothetical protein